MYQNEKVPVRSHTRWCLFFLTLLRSRDTLLSPVQRAAAGGTLPVPPFATDTRGPEARCRNRRSPHSPSPPDEEVPRVQIWRFLPFHHPEHNPTARRLGRWLGVGGKQTKKKAKQNTKPKQPKKNPKQNKTHHQL